MTSRTRAGGRGGESSTEEGALRPQASGEESSPGELGARVVEGALRLEGGLTWTLPAYNVRGLPNDFEGFLRGENPLEPNGRMNCWEAVIYAAIEGGVLNPEGVAKAFGAPLCDPNDYNKQMEDWLNLRARRPIEECSPQAGDVVCFFGLSHVVLSLGGDRVMSLWSGPGGGEHFEETTLGAMVAKTESNEEELRTYMKLAIEEYEGEVVGEEHLEAVMDSIFAYEDELGEWQTQWWDLLDELGEWHDLPAGEIRDGLERVEPEAAALWGAAMEELGWEEREEKGGNLFKLLMKVMELENPGRLRKLEALEVHYKAEFARIKVELAVVGVVPQAAVWERMKELAASS